MRFSVDMQNPDFFLHRWLFLRSLTPLITFRQCNRNKNHLHKCRPLSTPSFSILELSVIITEKMQHIRYCAEENSSTRHYICWHIEERTGKNCSKYSVRFWHWRVCARALNLKCVTSCCHRTLAFLLCLLHRELLNA